MTNGLVRKELLRQYQYQHGGVKKAPRPMEGGILGIFWYPLAQLVSTRKIIEPLLLCAFLIGRE